MGRPLDKITWEGYTRIPPRPGKKNSTAECHLCNRVFQKTASEFLKKHRSKCLNDQQNILGNTSSITIDEMGRQHDKGTWTGFTRIPRDGQKPVAQCNICHKVLVKTDATFLTKHRQNCLTVTGQEDSDEEVFLSAKNDKNSQNLFSPIIISTESMSNFEESQSSSLMGSPMDDGEKTFTEDLSPVENCRNPQNVAKKRKIESISNSMPNRQTLAQTHNYHTREDKLCALVNFLIASGADLDCIRSKHLRDFIKFFEPEFLFPDSEQFVKVFRDKAETRYYKDLSAQGFQKFCYVYTEELNGQVFAFGFAITKKHKYIYLCSEIFNKDDSEEILKCQLESFCDTTTQEFHSKYEKNVNCVIYDGRLTLDDIGKVNEDQPYFRMNCFSTLFHKLKKEHEPWRINSSTFEQEHKMITEYYKKIDTVQEEMISSHCSLGEGAERAMQLLEIYPQILNVRINDIITTFLRPAALGANFLNPKYKGHFILENSTLCKSMMSDFIHLACPPNGLDAFFYYQDVSLEFRELFDLTDDPVEFWRTAKKLYPELSDFALGLLAVPAVMPRLQKERLRRIQEKYSDNLGLQAFALTIIAND